MTRTTRSLRKLAWPMLGLAALLNAGCLLAVAGAAGAAGAAGYVYYNGLLYREYPVNLADAATAARAALADLQLPLEKETTDAGSLYLQSRTAKGDKIAIHLDPVGSPLPVDGVMTRVGVRVGFSGDDAVSGRILDQISTHVGKRVPVPAAAAGLGSPKAPETPPPPLATAPPAKR